MIRRISIDPEKTVSENTGKLPRTADKERAAVLKLSIDEPNNLFVITGKDYYHSKFESAYFRGVRLDIPADPYPYRNAYEKIARALNTIREALQHSAGNPTAERIEYKVQSMLKDNS
jgi:hypothetical protein